MAAAYLKADRASDMWSVFFQHFKFGDPTFEQLHVVAAVLVSAYRPGPQRKILLGTWLYRPMALTGSSESRKGRGEDW